MTEFETVAKLLSQVTRSLRVGILVAGAIVGSSLFAVLTDFIDQIDIAQITLRNPRCCEFVGAGPERYVSAAIVGVALIVLLIIGYTVCSSFLKEIRLLLRINNRLTRDMENTQYPGKTSRRHISSEEMLYRSYQSQVVYKLRDFSLILICSFLLVAVPALVWVFIPVYQGIVTAQQLQRFGLLGSTAILDPILFEGTIRFYVFQLVNYGLAVFLNTLLVVWSMQNIVKAFRINNIVSPAEDTSIQPVSELDAHFRVLRRHARKTV